MTRLAITDRNPPRIVAGLRERRRSGARVSGSLADHSAAAVAVTTPKPITQRHDPASTRALPMSGAATGVKKNTAWIRAITRAMASPAKRSRTMAWASDRGPAAASPHTNRLAKSMVSDADRAADRAEAAYRARAPSSTGLRPRASARGPKSRFPTPEPKKKKVTASDSLVESSASPKAGRMSAKAGRIRSMPKAAMAVISAMQNTNSRSPMRPISLRSPPPLLPLPPLWPSGPFRPGNRQGQAGAVLTPAGYA